MPFAHSKPKIDPLKSFTLRPCIIGRKMSVCRLCAAILKCFFFGPKWPPKVEIWVFGGIFSDFLTLGDDIGPKNENQLRDANAMV